MPRIGGPHSPRPGRVLGLYALAVMDRDGPIYGYSLAERIAGRTEGGWRPGPGAVYPALGGLVRRGLARAARKGRRRIYRITPTGRTFLRRVRREWAGLGRSGPDLGMLWSEIAGESDVGRHLLRHLQRHLDGIVTFVERDPATRAGAGSLASQLSAELRATELRLSALSMPVRPRRARRPS